jgi:hypothetical protein
MKSITNTLLLIVCVLIVGATGHYVTSVKQPANLQKIEDTIKLASLQQAEVSKLLVEQAASQDLAEKSLAQWKSRYKQIPPSLNTAEMLLYLENLTRTGFEKFDINLVGVTNQPDFSYYTFKVDATAYFAEAYHFVWHIENNREFYRINDLKVNYKPVFKENSSTGLPRRLNMVDFSFTLDAYFRASEGMVADEEQLAPVPTALLPRHQPSHNSFYPIIRTDLPPNDEMLLDVERSNLVSIIGTQAIFDGPDGQYVVSEGDRIYLGEVLQIDPLTSTVRVRLNKGGSAYVATIAMDVDRLDNIRQEGVEVLPVENQ